MRANKAPTHMAKLYVIKTGQTTFEEQSRVESAAGAPLSEQGIRDVQAAAKELASQKIGAIYAASGEAEQQTADLVGEVLGVKVRTDLNLREIDYGLWQGLRLKEIRHRQPKVYRQWAEAPTTVCPPGGETLAEAEQRIRKGLASIIKRHKGHLPLLVLRPVVLGLVRCILEKKSPEGLWEHAAPSFTWCSYETDEKLF